jgi:hypothetical protein
VWCSEAPEIALKSVNGEMSVNKASVGRGVPSRTLRDYLSLNIFAKREKWRKIVLS